MARLKSLNGNHAGRFLQVAPSEKNLRLTNAQFEWAARLRLGLSVTHIDNPDTDSCNSCGIFRAYQDDRWHHLSCHSHSGEGIARHNGLTDIIEQHVRMTGTQSRKEPAKLAELGKSRPDLQIFCPMKDWLIDVSVTHPLCPSHRDAAAKQSLDAAAKSAKIKDHKYQKMTEYQQATFSAFAVETLGGLHRSANKVINKIASLAQDNLSIYCFSTIRQSLLDSIAIGNQRGTARMLTAASVNKRILRYRQ